MSVGDPVEIIPDPDTIDPIPTRAADVDTTPEAPYIVETGAQANWTKYIPTSTPKSKLPAAIAKASAQRARISPQQHSALVCIQAYMNKYINIMKYVLVILAKGYGVFVSFFVSYFIHFQAFARLTKALDPILASQAQDQHVWRI